MKWLFVVLAFAACAGCSLRMQFKSEPKLQDVPAESETDELVC